MQIEITDTATVAQPTRLTFHNVRWSGIFAGLVVGLAVHVMLMLVGAAIGLAVFDVNTPTESGVASVPLAATIWNTLSMLVSAFVGGYIAARGAGLQRSFDGMLHGLIAWGLTLLLSAFVATSLTSATFGRLFATSQGTEAPAQVMRSIEAGDRQSAIDSLQRSLGLSNDQANRLVDQALVLSGRQENASPSGRIETEETVRSVAIASGWLSAAIVLSMLTSLSGGVAGARATRRRLVRRTVTV